MIKGLEMSELGFTGLKDLQDLLWLQLFFEAIKYQTILRRF